MCLGQFLDLCRRRLFIQVVAVICIGGAGAGCGNRDGRLTVTGTVTFDGQALPEGSISFRPREGTSSPSAGASISDGRFEVGSDKGVLPGEFDVAITATRKTGKKKMDPGTQTMFDEIEQYLPARYNAESVLQVEIKAGGKNELPFELYSD